MSLPRKEKVDHGALACAQHFNGILAQKAFPKNKWVLFPVGPISLVKEAKPGMHALIHAEGHVYQIGCPKMDWKNMDGCIVPYFQVKPTGAAQLANMEAHVVKVGDWQVPCYKNSSRVESGDQLLFLRKLEDEDSTTQPPSKRAKQGAK